MASGNNENNTKSNQFPVNLEEGLGVTALSYLVPTQDCELDLNSYYCFKAFY